VNGLKPVIARLAAGGTLAEAEAEAAFGLIMAGEATPAQIAGLLMALRVRGETVAELTGAVRAMRARMVAVSAPPGAMDIVGTGGDNVGSLNVSTAAALVVAGCGVPVAKHGNRALSSRSGAADVLAALGVNTDVPLDRLPAVLERAGMVFLMAPRHHAALRHAAGPRHFGVFVAAVGIVRCREGAHVPGDEPPVRQVGGADEQAPARPVLGGDAVEKVVGEDRAQAGAQGLQVVEPRLEQDAGSVAVEDVGGAGRRVDLAQEVVMGRAEERGRRLQGAGRDARDHVEGGPGARRRPARQHPGAEGAVGSTARQEEHVAHRPNWRCGRAPGTGIGPAHLDAGSRAGGEPEA